MNDIEKYIGKLVNIILINNERPSQEQLDYYELKEGDGVLIEDDFKDSRVIRKSLLSHSIITFHKADVVHPGVVQSNGRYDAQPI